MRETEEKSRYGGGGEHSCARHYTNLTKYVYVSIYIYMGLGFEVYIYIYIHMDMLDPPGSIFLAIQLKYCKNMYALFTLSSVVFLTKTSTISMIFQTTPVRFWDSLAIMENIEKRE